jgi:hypothetical protein
LLERTDLGGEKEGQGVIKEWNVASSNNEHMDKGGTACTALSTTTASRGGMVWERRRVRYIDSVPSVCGVALESTACTKVGIGEDVQILDRASNARQNPGRTLGWRSLNRPMVAA